MFVTWKKKKKGLSRILLPKKLCAMRFCLNIIFLENELSLCNFFFLSDLITKWYRKSSLQIQ